MRQIANGNGNAHTVSRTVASGLWGRMSSKCHFQVALKWFCGRFFKITQNATRNSILKSWTATHFRFRWAGKGRRRGEKKDCQLRVAAEFNRLRLLPLLALRFIWQTISLTKKRSTTERVLCLCSPSPWLRVATYCCCPRACPKKTSGRRIAKWVLGLANRTRACATDPSHKSNVFYRHSSLFFRLKYFYWIVLSFFMASQASQPLARVDVRVKVRPHHCQLSHCACVSFFCSPSSLPPPLMLI